MPAGSGHQELATAKHQRRQVVIGFGGGVEPVAVGRPLDIGRTQWIDGALANTIGAGDIAIDVSGLIDETISEGDLLQGRQHAGIATSQRLQLQLVDAFAQLAEDLLQAREKALALGVHLLDFALLQLMHGHAHTGHEQQDRAGRSRECGQ
ncbi:hypothetical protein D3C77_529520 [compost metagenome]